jgi:hypothetical protein
MTTQTYATPGMEISIAVAKLIGFLETGLVPEGLFAPQMFTDLTLPHWRIQATTAEEMIAIRSRSHPSPGQVRVERVEQTAHGFTIEFEERWNSGGQPWYSREMIRADLMDHGIVDMSIYCTGDWDQAKQRQHAESVHLVRS